MPEVLGNPPSPRTTLFWNGTAWQWALVDAAGHIQIDALSTVMDAAAATAANQVLMITALQIIDNLVVALGGPGNVRLQVRGEDQLFSFHSVLAIRRSAVVSGANGFLDSIPVPAGQIWKVTTIMAVDVTSPTTQIYFVNRHNAVLVAIHDERRAYAAGETTQWAGETYLDVDDTIRATFVGALVGDTCVVEVTGHIMTPEV